MQPSMFFFQEQGDLFDLNSSFHPNAIAQASGSCRKLIMSFGNPLQVSPIFFSFCSSIAKASACLARSCPNFPDCCKSSRCDLLSAVSTVTDNRISVGLECSITCFADFTST